MKLLLDTHCLIWALADSPQLGDAARVVMARAEEIAFSEASVWEIGLKWRKGKIKLQPRRVFEQALQDGQPPQQPGGQPVGPPQQGQQPHQQPGGQLVGQPKAVPPSPPWERGIERRLDRVEELVMEMRDTLQRLERGPCGSKS